MEKVNEIVVYQPDEIVNLEVRVENESVWLTLNQIATLFDRDKSVISRYISNVYKEKELDKISTVAKNATVQIENGRSIVRQLDYYNLDVIIFFSILSVSSKQSPNPLPIEPRDILAFDEFRTFGLTSIGISAITEAQFIHFGNHLLHSVGGFDFALGQQSQMADFCSHEQHGASVLASGHTGATADA